MAARPPRFQVAVTAEAASALDQVWRSSADRYGHSHADAYLRLLKDAIRSLEVPSAVGKAVPGRPNVYYLLVRRRASGHGHILVYEIPGNQVSVLRLYHTAQDWQAKLAADKTLD